MEIELEWLLPGVAPTRREIVLPLAVLVEFRDGRIACERLYWDQASVLVQAGLLDAARLPVRGAEAAREVLGTVDAQR